MADQDARSYFVTIASNQPLGCGYWEVHAENAAEAHRKAVRQLGTRWAFLYESLDEVHELDRIKHGEIA